MKKKRACNIGFKCLDAAGSMTRVFQNSEIGIVYSVSEGVGSAGGEEKGRRAAWQGNQCGNASTGRRCSKAEFRDFVHLQCIRSG